MALQWVSNGFMRWLYEMVTISKHQLAAFFAFFCPRTLSPVMGFRTNPQQMFLSVVSVGLWEAAPTLQAEKNHRFDLPGGSTWTDSWDSKPVSTGNGGFILKKNHKETMETGVNDGKVIIIYNNIHIYIYIYIYIIIENHCLVVSMIFSYP